MSLPSKTTARRIATLALATTLFAGCGVDETPPPAAPKPTTPVAAKPAESESIAAEAPTPTAEELAYTPPFPDREDLFSPPKNAPRATRGNRDGTADDVVLMGFANLEGPRVVLAIDGVVKPLGDGDEAAGVRVISIAPPRAVLQRGRSRWTASIE